VKPGSTSLLVSSLGLTLDLCAGGTVRDDQEEQMLGQAMATLSPQCRRSVELLFLETPPRQYAEVVAELGLTLGSIGFTRQKCSERLRQSLHDQGFH
jgi:DNA-directed RNA polymerase specialized sigma24 family protein